MYRNMKYLQIILKVHNRLHAQKSERCANCLKGAELIACTEICANCRKGAQPLKCTEMWKLS